MHPCISSISNHSTDSLRSGELDICVAVCQMAKTHGTLRFCSPQHLPCWVSWQNSWNIPPWMARRSGCYQSVGDIMWTIWGYWVQIWIWVWVKADSWIADGFSSNVVLLLGVLCLAQPAQRPNASRFSRTGQLLRSQCCIGRPCALLEAGARGQATALSADWCRSDRKVPVLMVEQILCPSNIMQLRIFLAHHGELRDSLPCFASTFCWWRIVKSCRRMWSPCNGDLGRRCRAFLLGGELTSIDRQG